MRKLLKLFYVIYSLKRKFEFVKFSPYAFETTRGCEEAGGFDLYSVDNYTIRQRTSHIIRTDIGFKIAKGYFIKVHPRSSFALCITDVGGGVIDADYRGSVSVIFFNFSDRFIHTEKGDRFCPIIFQKIASILRLTEVEKSTDATKRGESPFG